VKEKTDWLLMMKMKEENANGGESVLLHLDDWEDLDMFMKDPVAKENFIWGSPKSKNIDYKIEHPVFSKDKEGRPIISYIDQFPEPTSLEQGLFLNKLSNSLENSITTSLLNCLLVILFFLIIIFYFMEEEPSNQVPICPESYSDNAGYFTLANCNIICLLTNTWIRIVSTK
jgi:CsiD.